MLKLKKTAVAVALGVGCVASAQAWYEGERGTLSSDNPLIMQDTFSLFQTPLFSANANVLDWYTFSVDTSVSSATGTLSVSSNAFLTFGTGTDNLKFTVYEGTYRNELNLGVNADVFKVAFPNTYGLKSVGSFELQSDGTLNGTYNFNPAVSNYTLVISGVAADVALFGQTNYTFTMSSVSAVPEPAEYAMLLAGLGVVGMVARRRRIKK